MPININRKETIVANDPGPCPSCPDYQTCTEMCEKVEMWSNQDTVGRNGSMLLQNHIRYDGSEGLDTFVDYCKYTHPDVLVPDSTLSIEAWNDVCSMKLSDKIVRMIYSYYMLGKRIRDIAIDEGASSQAIDQRHIQAKKSIAKRLRQREHWLSVRDKLEYRSTRDYDVSYLFFSAGYPRKIIAKIMRLHVTTIIKIISNKIKEIGTICPD